MPPRKHMMTQLEMARMGGKARAESMTPDERTKIARLAANARWEAYRKRKAEEAAKVK